MNVEFFLLPGFPIFLLIYLQKCEPGDEDHGHSQATIDRLVVAIERSLSTEKAWFRGSTKCCLPLEASTTRNAWSVEGIEQRHRICVSLAASTASTISLFARHEGMPINWIIKCLPLLPFFRSAESIAKVAISVRPQLFETKSRFRLSQKLVCRRFGQWRSSTEGPKTDENQKENYFQHHDV